MDLGDSKSFSYTIVTCIWHSYLFLEEHELHSIVKLFENKTAHWNGREGSSIWRRQSLLIDIVVACDVRILGYWPFSTAGANKNIHSYFYIKGCDWFWFIVSIVILVLLSCIFIIVIVKANQNMNSQAKLIEGIIGNITVLSFTLVGLFYIIIDMINRYDLWKTISIFYDFDEEVGKC